jgi:glycerol-3-phosphate dehydrogenase
MKICIIGGGINGIFAAWRLSVAGHHVELFDSGKVLGQTSSASSKLLHGGIRYLEHGHLGLVREALLDRQWWLENAPQFAKPIEITIPIYKGISRPALVVYAGVVVYRFLAGRRSLGPNKWLGADETERVCPEIASANLAGSVSFFDAQMDEKQLGEWVKGMAESSGCIIRENCRIDSIDSNGTIFSTSFGGKKFDAIVNCCGPWASQLLQASNIDSNFGLTMVRGSHLYIDQTISRHYLFQEAKGDRVVFVLPYLGKTLIGTTEVTQSISEPIKCSDYERQYLIDIYNKNFNAKIDTGNILDEYSGLRPIVTSRVGGGNLSTASRESKIEVVDKLINVYGGKWTTSPSLSKKVLLKIKNLRDNL